MNDKPKPGFEQNTPMIFVVMVAVVLFLAAEVFHSMMQEMEQIDAEQVTDVCMGLWGCGGPPTEVLSFILVSVIIFILSIGVSKLFVHRKPSKDTDELDGVKKLYVEGEIGILEFEERVEDEIDGEDNE